MTRFECTGSWTVKKIQPTLYSMVIVYGTCYFGKVDHMDDGSYVPTRFFHFMFIPLITLSTFWVTGEERDSYRAFSTGHPGNERKPSMLFQAAVALGRILNSRGGRRRQIVLPNDFRIAFNRTF